VSCERSLTLDNWVGGTKINCVYRVKTKDWDFMSWHLPVPIISLHNSSKVRQVAE